MLRQRVGEAACVRKAPPSAGPSRFARRPVLVGPAAGTASAAGSPQAVGAAPAVPVSTAVPYVPGRPCAPLAVPNLPGARRLLDGLGRADRNGPGLPGGDRDSPRTGIGGPAPRRAAVAAARPGDAPCRPRTIGGVTADGGRSGKGARVWRSWSLPLVALACALAVVAGLALDRALVAGDPPRASSTLSGERAALDRVLDRRAAAVLDRDERAFLAVVDGGAERFRDRQRDSFSNLAGVPLASWSYRLRGTRAFALPSGPGRRIAAEVGLSYRIKGYDAEPVTATEYLTFAERGGHWRIASDSDGERSGRGTVPQLWDLGRVRTVFAPSSLVLGLGAREELARYSAGAEAAVPAVERSWNARWSGKIVLTVPRTLAQMAAMLGARPSSYKGIAAVTTGGPGGPDGADGPAARRLAPADRITVNPEAFGGLADFGRLVVLTHETTHVATRAYTASWTPLWLSEGFADWVGYRETGRTPAEIAPALGRDVRAGKVPERLPDDAAFDATGNGLAQAYEMAWSACRLIAERYGPDRLTALYRAVGDRGRGADGVDRTMKDVLGVGLDAFTREWRAGMARELV